MTTNQYQQIISKELFHQNNERLKYLITVFKSHKKKTKFIYFLAISVSNINTHTLYFIKKVDQTFKKDKTWQFDEILQINPLNNAEEPEFEILFNNKQTFRWIACSQTEKQTFLQFIKQIINQVPAYFDIKFVNIENGEPTSALVFNQMDDIFINEKTENIDWNQDDSYQALTGREEADLERLLNLEVENTINNAEAFTEKLSRDLASMDSLNIQDIMASEQRVLDLMQMLQNTIDETYKLENKIKSYENLLQNVRDIVQKVEKKEAIVQTCSDNNKQLLEEMGKLVKNLDFSKEEELLLNECDLYSPSYMKYLVAAQRLQEVFQYEIPSELESLKAVVEQKKYLNEVASRFLLRLMDQLKRIISDLANEYNQKLLTLKSQDTVLSEHTRAHKKLVQYGGFIKWIRAIDSNSYAILITYYSQAFGSVYEKEFGYFFEYLRERNVYNSKGLNPNVMPSVEAKRKSLAVNDVRNAELRRGSTTPSSNTDAIDSISLKSSEVSLSEWDEFDSYIEFMLKTIDPVCLAEQSFCNKFFDLENFNVSIPSTPVLVNKNNLNNEVDVSNQSSSNVSDQSNQSKKNDKLRNILVELFKSLENEMISFVSHYDKVDGLYSIYFLVRLTNHVLCAQDSGSFLSKAYGNILINVKRNFDRYMTTQQIEIEETKDPKRAKIGVLSFIRRFENFSKQTENILKYGSQRRNEIDRWYTTLVEKIFQSISRIAKEHAKIYKTPSQMIEIENYHYLHIMLSSLKIPCLENEKKQAKICYNQSLKEYVNLYFMRPLEKLNQFFDGVQQKVKQGIKEDEIGYQLAYSKQELRKIIKECNLKDIKKGLEEMYKRVEKHVSDPESTLIQVIWRSMQEEFIIQYKYIQELIERCYPQSNISMNFTIEDVLNIFSEIAQTH